MEVQIPHTDLTASIGITLDVQNEKETIAIGNPDEIKQYFTHGNISRNIHICTRKLGTLIDEMNTLACEDMSAISAASEGLFQVIADGQGKKQAAKFVEILNNLYETGEKANMLRNYIIFFVYSNFSRLHKSQNKDNHIFRQEMKKSAKKFADEYNSVIHDLLLPFKNLPTVPQGNVRYWNIDEQIKTAPSELVVHVYRCHTGNTWRTGYIADDSFPAILYIYVDILKQANVIVRNCSICHKLILTNKNVEIVSCGDPECVKRRHSMVNAASRAKSMENPIQKVYNKFYSLCSNYRRKFARRPDLLEKYNEKYEKYRNKVLNAKKKLSEDSPYSEFAAFEEMTIKFTEELREYSRELLNK